MVTVNVGEAKTTLSKLLEAAERGEEIVIARDGEPVARLVPVVPPPRRRLGFVSASPVSDDVFDPLDEELLEGWT